MCDTKVNVVVQTNLASNVSLNFPIYQRASQQLKDEEKIIIIVEANKNTTAVFFLNNFITWKNITWKILPLNALRDAQENGGINTQWRPTERQSLPTTPFAGCFL